MPLDNCRTDRQTADTSGASVSACTTECTPTRECMHSWRLQVLSPVKHSCGTTRVAEDSSCATCCTACSGRPASRLSLLWTSGTSGNDVNGLLDSTAPSRSTCKPHLPACSSSAARRPCSQGVRSGRVPALTCRPTQRPLAPGRTFHCTPVCSNAPQQSNTEQTEATAHEAVVAHFICNR
jgi:hypothetical protein